MALVSLLVLSKYYHLNRSFGGKNPFFVLDVCGLANVYTGGLGQCIPLTLQELVSHFMWVVESNIGAGVLF